MLASERKKHCAIVLSASEGARNPLFFAIDHEKTLNFRE
jgi:hypothetical protein